MFSDHVGVRVPSAYGEALRVRSEAVGHAIYGPYDHVRPGRIRVDFPIARADDEAIDQEAVCATIDIAAYHGAAILAAKPLHGRDLTRNMAVFSIELNNEEFRSLEYRVAVSGVTSLVLAQPRFTRLSDVRGELPDADPTKPTSDPVELQRQIRAILRPLRPFRAKGRSKVRLGHKGDGGYVCLDDFKTGDVALSLGINDDISWDSDAADRGLIIHQFDHTVDDPAPHDDRMVFNKTMIAAETAPGQVSLSDLIRKHDKGERRPNLILKMDIEGYEWPALKTVSAHELSRFSQILCELHCFDDLHSATRRQQISDRLGRITKNFFVSHVHANACGGLSNIANVTIPNVIEFSFANKALFEAEETDELFPGSLDYSCDAYAPDIYLGSFRF